LTVSLIGVTARISASVNSVSPATSTVSMNDCACPPNVAVQVTVHVSSSAVCAGVTVYVTFPVPASVAAAAVTSAVPSARVIVTVAESGDGSVATLAE
jgi:hypothetical protein